MTERKQTCWINNRTQKERRKERTRDTDKKQGERERERLTTGFCNMKENPVSVKSG